MLQVATFTLPPSPASHVTVAAAVILLVQAAMSPSAAIQCPGTAVQHLIVSTARHVALAQAIVPAEALFFQFIVKSCGYVKEKKCVRRIE